MARPRKELSNSTGDRTKIVQIQKENEENFISWMDDDLLSEPPKELRDGIARKSWKRILPDLKKLAEKMACNMDRDNLIMYCNAWSTYMEAQEALKKIDPETDPRGFDRWHRVMNTAMDMQRKYGSQLGMSIDSRLKMATAAIKKQEEKMEAKFGVI